MATAGVALNLYLTDLSNTAPLRIAFIHPDLGIGGSERLVLDAALELQKAGHQVTLFTTHCDSKHCFEEARDGTLDVRVLGDFLPSHLGHCLRAPCTVLRMLYVSLTIVLGRESFDVIFCDLVAHVVPVLRRWSQAQILFYCHYPDRLLAPQRGRWYRCYRWPIERLEEWGLARAHQVLVNSYFTLMEFRQAFPRLQGVTPEVVYPGVAMTAYRGIGRRTRGSDLIILSINRYEPQKNLALVLEALALSRQRLPSRVFNRVRVIFAGGYDKRLQNNRETLRDLETCAEDLGLANQVSFIRSCTDRERLELLRDCLCVVYTPEREHFGLVPIEAMAAGRPVIAVNSGGPLETVRHEETGLLCAPSPEAFADALSSLLIDPARAERMGRIGQEHVAECFSRSAFGARLEALLPSHREQ